MTDTYQATMTHTGRRVGDVTLTIQRTAGTSCDAFTLVYVNPYYFHPDRTTHIMHLDFDLSTLPAFAFPTCICVKALEVIEV